MSDRTIGPLSRSARDLLRDARAEALPTLSDRARSLARLQVLDAGPASVPPPASGHPPVRRTRLGARVKVLLAVAAVLVTAASAAAVRRVIASPVVPETSAPSPEAPATASPPARAARPIEAAVASHEPVALHAVPDPHPSKTERRPRKAPSAERVDELTLLGNARQALAAHQGADALRWLDEDSRRFPASAFLEERAYARIRALCELRRDTEAASEAERFLQRWPASVYAPGARRACSSPDEPTTRPGAGPRP
jgi:hypothetical protein